LKKEEERRREEETNRKRRDWTDKENEDCYNAWGSI